MQSPPPPRQSRSFVCSVWRGMCFSVILQNGCDQRLQQRSTTAKAALYTHTFELLLLLPRQPYRHRLGRIILFLFNHQFCGLSSLSFCSSFSRFSIASITWMKALRAFRAPTPARSGAAMSPGDFIQVWNRCSIWSR